MEKHTRFPNKRLTAWGIGYLLFQLLVLPTILSLFLLILELPLDDSKLNMLYYTVNFGILVCIFWRFLQDNLRHALENIGAVLLPAVVGFFVYRFSSTVVDMVIYGIFPDFYNANDANINSMAQGQLPMWAFATIVLVPPVEELLFRGTLFGGFYNKHKVLAWILSVLGFALVHVIGYIGYYSWEMLLLCTIQYLPAGICFAAAYRASGNIFTPILMHSAINAIAIIAMAAM